MYKTTDDNAFEVVRKDFDDWKDFYSDSQETITRHIPEDLVKYVVIKDDLDYNHTGNMESMISRSGITIYVNNSPIICYSKK